jgi:hypothetical protein
MMQTPDFLTPLSVIASLIPLALSIVGIYYYKPKVVFRNSQRYLDYGMNHQHFSYSYEVRHGKIPLEKIPVVNYILGILYLFRINGIEILEDAKSIRLEYFDTSIGEYKEIDSRNWKRKIIQNKYTTDKSDFMQKIAIRGNIILNTKIKEIKVEFYRALSKDEILNKIKVYDPETIRINNTIRLTYTISNNFDMEVRNFPLRILIRPSFINFKIVSKKSLSDASTLDTNISDIAVDESTPIEEYQMKRRGYPFLTWILPKLMPGKTELILEYDLNPEVRE